MTPQQLSWFVDDVVARNLQSVKGVGKVERIGGVAGAGLLLELCDLCVGDEGGVSQRRVLLLERGEQLGILPLKLLKLKNLLRLGLLLLLKLFRLGLLRLGVIDFHRRMRIMDPLPGAGAA